VRGLSLTSFLFLKNFPFRQFKPSVPYTSCPPHPSLPSPFPVGFFSIPVLTPFKISFDQAFPEAIFRTGSSYSFIFSENSFQPNGDSLFFLSFSLFWLLFS